MAAGSAKHSAANQDFEAIHPNNPPIHPNSPPIHPPIHPSLLGFHWAQLANGYEKQYIKLIWREFRAGSGARIQSWVSCQPDSGGSETNFEFEFDEKPSCFTKGTGSCASLDILEPPTSRPTPHSLVKFSPNHIGKSRTWRTI